MGYGRNYGRRPQYRQTTGRIQKANARPGPCKICGTEIPAGRGQLYRNADGSWAVVHLPQEWKGSPVSGRYVGGCPEDTAKLNRDGGWGQPAVSGAYVTSSGASVTGSRGKCEDAPCCGCCA